VRTLDPGRPFASAVAIRDGVIIDVGDDAQIRELGDATTEVIDLAGACVVPGLIDSHIHPFHGAQTAVGADLTGLRTLEEVRAALATERARSANGWVQGYALAYEAFTDTGIHGALINEAVAGAPALVSFFDFHTALATPAALEHAGVDGPRVFPAVAEVVCADGVPTGELREDAAVALVRDAIPPFSHDQRLAAYTATLRSLNAVGITGCCVMLGSPALYDECRELEASGDLSVRAWVPLHLVPDVSDDQVDEFLLLAGARGRLWRGGVAKFFIDGVVEPGTAWLYEPDTNGQGRLPFWPDPYRYSELVTRFTRAGFQCATHAVGDRAVRAALDAYQAAGVPPTGHHRIEHIETLKDQDLPRFAEERVAASMQPLHLRYNQADRSDPWSRALGRERCDRGFRTREVLDSGAILALGSDWPVAGYDPRLGMGWARLRRDPGRPDLGQYNAEQAITGLEALDGYTTQPARIVGEARKQGRIMRGFRADLSCFAEDPVDTDADSLLELPVAATIVDGRVVYRAG
jgi:predicted amidohydrolase YtcJ